ncbi:MAG: OmpA family protein [Alphaproteobacteria bacterium]|nr:OmpA family protein [Alphaproteobacteria bacterium]
MARHRRSLLLALILAASPASAQDVGDTDTDVAAVDQATDTGDDYVPTGGRTVTCSTSPSGATTPLALGLALFAAAAGLRRRRRSVHRRAAALTVAALATSISGSAHAQSAGTPGMRPSLDVNRFEASGMISGFAQTYSARQLAAKRFSVDVLGVYAWRPLQASQDIRGDLIRREPAIEHLGSLHLRASVGATDWLQISLSAPAVQVLQLGYGLDRFAGPVRAPVAGGDIALELAFRPLDEAKGFGLSITPFATAPTGPRSYVLTDGVPTFGGRLAMSGQASIVHLAAYASYKVKIGHATLGRYVAIDDEIAYGAGLGVYLVPQLLRFNVELAGVSTVGVGRQLVLPLARSEQLHTALEANADLLVTTQSGLAFLLGGGAGLTPAPGSPSVRAFLGLGYVPVAAVDTDHDGISDRDDDCPKVPEDLDDFEDEDGCPDTDNDGDGLLDTDDDCPDDAEDDDGFQDTDGCPDVDDDGDGILDGADGCPRMAEDLDGFEDEDGCPEADNDHDGFADEDDACPNHPEDFDGDHDDDGCPDEATDKDGDGLVEPIDQCPTIPEDFDGFADDDGCPDVDNDGDGIPDATDGCPDAPEDFDGFSDEDGCPDFDADGDGIPDGVDRCVLEPEVINGFEDEDGCPDEGKVKLTAERIEILERILFYVDEARIRESSYPVLDAVVAVMKDHPEIARIRIEGHTDSQGAEAYNQDLSERRALAVRQYLVDAGISPTRLLARGYGELYPVAPNGSEEGRAQNRRVEFVILPPEE